MATKGKTAAPAAPKTIVETVKVGSILSESNFYTVSRIEGDFVFAKNDDGVEIRLSKAYVNQCTVSADLVNEEKEMTKTQLAELFINSPRVAMTVAFIKQGTEKTQKAFNAEKAEAIRKIRQARVSDVEGLLNDLIDNPLSRTIPGALRVMKGRHFGRVDELGRVQFIDMEQARGDKEHDARLRQVDPRTIQYLIIEGVKYNLK